MREDRGVSTTLSYILALTIITLLVSGLFIAGGGLVADQRERAVRSEFRVLSNQLASDLSTADRLVATTDPTSVTVRTRLPTTVAGSSYSINVSAPPGGPAAIEMTSTDPDVSVTLSVATDTDVANTTAGGGDVVVSYEGGELEVQDA